MTDKRTKPGFIALRWTLGLVILIEAVLFLMPGARPEFATQMPAFVRQLLGWGEILGAILLLIPQTVVRGAWVLIAAFVLAIAVHLLLGMFNIGNPATYTVATWILAVSR